MAKVEILLLAMHLHWSRNSLYYMSTRERKMWVETLKEWKEAEKEELEKNR